MAECGWWGVHVEELLDWQAMATGQCRRQVAEMLPQLAHHAMRHQLVRRMSCTYSHDCVSPRTSYSQ
jgi:hypothetical protein|eukprot:COSAG01_NODE_5253_length_4382_cov_285.432407_6_plen_67_part_00